jgi:hypothetical protein
VATDPIPFMGQSGHRRNARLAAARWKGVRSKQGQRASPKGGSFFSKLNLLGFVA